MWIDGGDRENDAEELYQHLLDVAEEARLLADALYEIGNDKLSEKVYRLSNQVNHSVRRLESLNRQALDEYVKRSDQGSLNVLNAALAGIELGRDRK